MVRYWHDTAVYLSVCLYVCLSVTLYTLRLNDPSYSKIFEQVNRAYRKCRRQEFDFTTFTPTPTLFPLTPQLLHVHGLISVLERLFGKKCR